ncbi:MAG: hypothetical protein J6T56_05245, partial [Bacteroidales bacterium]|nr:hypothetical protein [Bacteroidales bacterium]
YDWKGSLASYKDTVISIGTYQPVSGLNNVVVWLSNQNGISTGDSVASNDTIRNHSFGCTAAMSGKYRIGLSKSADFPDIKSALDMLASCGASAPITFELESGKYESFTVNGYYSGVSGRNTVTITSLSGKASDVVISGGSPVITFGAPHFRLDRVTVDGTTSNSTCGIQIAGAVNDIRITHNIIMVDPNATTSSYYGIQCVNGYKRDSIIIVGNHVDGGYYGIYFYNGTSTTNTDHGRFHRVDSNTVTNAYYYGIYAYYTDMFSYSYNNVSARMSGGNSYFYGMYSYYGNIDSVVNNRVDAIRDYLGYGYGIYVNYSNYTYAQSTTDTSLFANNEVRVSGTSTPYGLYCSYGRNNVVHNSVYVLSTGSSGYGIYAYNSNTGYRNNLYNNNSVMIGGTSGYPVYTYTASTYAYLSGNNYYHENGTNLAYIGGARANLSAVKNYDATATEVMPEFIDVTKGMHIRKSTNSGIDCPLNRYATKDINDEMRPSTPIRGCYNPVELTYNAALTDFPNPQILTGMVGNQMNVSVTLLNRGDSTITSADVYWEVNGTAQTTYKWTGTLTSDKKVQLNLGSFVVVNGNNVIKAYVHLNDSKDVLAVDDTISITVFGCGTGALKGTYTVGGTNGFFPTFEDAMVAVSKCGLAGPVVLQLAPGIYKSVALTGAFNGGSHTNSVTVTSSTGKKEDVIIGGGESYALDLMDVSNLHFTDITIGDTVQIQQAIVVENTMKNVTFTNCNIYAISGVSTTTYAGVYRPTSSSYKIDTLSFRKCHFYGGYQNIHLYYGGTQSDDGHLILDSCELLGAMYYGFNCPYPGYYVLTAMHNYFHNHRNAATYY